MNPDKRAAMAMVSKEPAPSQLSIVSESAAQVMIRAIGQGFNAADGQNRPTREQDWDALMKANAGNPTLGENLGKIKGWFETCMGLYQPGQLRPTFTSKELNHMTDTFSHEVLSTLIMGIYASGRNTIQSFDDFKPEHVKEMQGRYDRALEALFKDAPMGSDRGQYYSRLTTPKVLSQLLRKTDILFG